MSHNTMYELFQSVCASNASKIAYRFKKDGRWVDVTWDEQRATVARVSKALMALGVKHGDRVSIMSNTRLEWIQSDFGTVNCGGVTVGIYQSNLAKDAAYVADHSDSEIIFVENEMQLEKVVSTHELQPRIRQIVIYDGSSDPTNDVLSWNDFLAKGDEVSDAQAVERAQGIGPDDVAGLVYTSGTTGVPKGVMLTHRNILFTTWSAGQALYMKEGFSTLLFLPLAHVFARLIAYCSVAVAVTVAFAEDLTKIPENLKEVRPDFIVSVPRIYEKFYDKILSGAEKAGGMKTRLFHWAVGVGGEVSRLQQAGRPIPALLRLRHALATKLVLHKIQAAFGGRLIYAISGAAPLNQTIGEFFHACGVTILEGIGMTENTSFTNVNTLERNKFGTVGPVGPGIEVKIAEDGEVLYRGDNVMKGYFKNPEATAETIDSEGWLHTGDIGEIDDDGYLRITDRKKDLIITAGGKNVAPQRIERVMRTSHYISQAVAYGDKRKFITALFTLDVTAVREWASGNGIELGGEEDLAAHARVDELVRGEVERLNRELASFESIKRFHIAPRDLTVEDGDLTPTLKIKRKVVIDKYRDQIEALYPD